MAHELAVLILNERYFELKNKVENAKIEMDAYPNEHDYKFIEKYEPIVNDLEKSINILKQDNTCQEQQSNVTTTKDGRNTKRKNSNNRRRNHDVF